MEYSFLNGYLQVFLLIFSRIMGLFVTAPFYSGLAMTMRFKLMFAFFLSLIALPLVTGMGITAPSDFADFGVKLVSNFVFGAGIGFFIFIILQAFQVAAQVFSIQMGLGMNEVFDPISDTQVPAVGNVLGIMIILILVQVDGHFFMVEAIVNSFKTLDLVNLQASGMLVKGFLNAVIVMFEVALKISMPIIAVMLLLDIAMGIILRVAPQVNVMIMGFNLKILAGFMVLWVVIGPLYEVGKAMIDQVFVNTSELIRYFKR